MELLFEVTTDRVFAAKVVGPKEMGRNAGYRETIYQGPKDKAEIVARAMNHFFVCQKGAKCPWKGNGKKCK